MDSQGFETRGSDPAPDHPVPVEFSGDTMVFFWMVLVNGILSLLTLGIYRFWGKAKVRRYLWEKTSFFGEPLEWTGTGMELFLGFLAALFVILLPLGLVIGAAQFLLLHPATRMLGGILIFIPYIGIIYLLGVAVYKAVRYRLTRTLWRGIRGGADAKGWRYGLTMLKLRAVQFFSLGIATPWASIQMWNRRTNEMSFGPTHFQSTADSKTLYKRFLLAFVIALGFVSLFIIAELPALKSLKTVGPANPPDHKMLGGLFGAYFALIIALNFIWLSYHALFYRMIFSNLHWGNVQFHFDARSKDWLLFILSTIGWGIVTLGFANLVLPLRYWRFFSSHLSTTGNPDYQALTQSTALAPTQGEGLADAFDIGAV